MIGILVQLSLSWIIIRLIEQKDLSVLGFRPTKERVTDLFLFFVITAAFCAFGFVLKIVFGPQQWRLNPDLSFQFILSSIWWDVRSVLFEELIFRGVLLYILIKRTGTRNAILISATAFGIYHWFTWGVMGNPMQMAIVFILTGTMGLLLAYGYAKTFSLYLPTAIHLGWNLTQNFIFAQGPLKTGLLIPSSEKFRTGSYTVYFMVTLLPVTLMLLTNYLLIRYRKRSFDTSNAPAVAVM